MTENLINRITYHLSSGGLFNPELADHLAVRNLLMECREALAQPEQGPVNKYCCHLCFKKSGQMFLDRMLLCPECGNKRCPKATSHELPCTNSNEPNQSGSIYTTSPHQELIYTPPQRTWVELTEDDISELIRATHNTGSFVRAIEAKLKEKNT